MGEFFKGWHKKFGVVTLLMALAIMAGWGRSHIAQDKVSFPVGGGIEYDAELTPAGIVFCKFGQISIGPNQVLRARKDGWSIDDLRAKVVDDRAETSADSESAHEKPIDKDGDGVGVSISGGGALFITLGEIVVPYWFVITPLTLLSAYLLFSRSEPTTSTKSTVPVVAQ
jgi:hypothetical protein